MKKLLYFLFIVSVIISCKTTGNTTKFKSPNIKRENENNNDLTYAFTEATKQQLFGNYSQAVYLYRQCLQVNKNHAPSYYQLSRIFAMSDDKAISINFAKKACTIDKQNYWYLINLASIYQISKKPDSAVYVYEDIVNKFPEKQDVKLQLAYLYNEVGKYSKSLALVNKIESQSGVSEQTSMPKYSAFIGLKKYTEAIAVVNQLLKQNPDELKYYGIIAELYGDIGKKQEALENYNKIFASDPYNKMALFSLIELYKAYNDTTNLFSTYSKIANAKELDFNTKLQFLSTLVNDEKTTLILNGKEKVYFEKLETENPDNEYLIAIYTDFLLKHNDTKNAISKLNKLVTINKTNYAYWERLLYIHGILNNNDSVIKVADEALKVFSDKPALYLIKGLSLFNSQKFTESVKSYNSALAIPEINVNQKLQAFTFLGENYFRLDSFDLSCKYFDQALEIDSSNIYILNNYSYYLSLKETNLQKADRMMQMVMKIEPNNPTYIDTYAWVLYKLKDYKNALVHIKRAVKLDNHMNGEIVEHYADILYCNGYIEEAKQNWHSSIALGQNKTEILRKIENFNCK